MPPAILEPTSTEPPFTDSSLFTTSNSIPTHQSKVIKNMLKIKIKIEMIIKLKLKLKI